METREVNEFRDTKPHQREEWLRNAYLVEGKEVGDLANELNVSVKLIHILLKEYGII